MKFTLQQIARAIAAPLPVDPRPSAALSGGWSIDSRTLQPGDVFFALRGPHHDGHSHLAEVFRKGARAAVVDVESAAVDHLAHGAGPLLRVRNTLDALQQLARWARLQWPGEVIAVTGSAGKTTTKDLIAEMLSVEFKADRNAGNLNNHIGLPLSFLRLDETARMAVLEMGMNHAGEIRHLAALAQPNVGVVTNVGFAHIENFKSVAGIAAAKRELIEALPAAGIAVLNADDPVVAEFARVHPGRTILYGESPAAEVRAEAVKLTSEGAQFQVSGVQFQTPLFGRHNVSNILAGIAVAGIYGISPLRLVERVQSLQPDKMRGARQEHNGITVYNDCYNSNPAAARALLDVLRDTPARKRVAVLGEMGELGTASAELHREVGVYAASTGVDFLIGVRGHAAEMISAAASAGIQTRFFEAPAPAGAWVAEIAKPGDAVLFKGSRAVRMELAVKQFLAVTDPDGRVN